ncbi:type 1 glutamine amidotransferase domain-containing protein [Alcanivorax sp. JB21]|uniref:type 1 glutamine amidotransferase domain-containing protein n=1 Tax=Alcanivorax limicola TaxID=2874102 RepID=UPI001CBD5A9F|nr:type 1 glutamine amidotransferase domain-containing protein [Alcanivorax limicola]MBZ2188752.1 type 1 glutamine amidotransferase domain-containing protein [Alcanivorax limicola]
MSKRILMVITSASTMSDGDATGLWLEEFAVPWQAFTTAGLTVTVATMRPGEAPIDPRSTPDDEQRRQWAGAIDALAAAASLEDVWEHDVDAIFIPGGHGTMFDMPDNPLLAGAIEQAYANGAIVAAVCHGPAAFVGPKKPDGSPVVSGHRLTCFTNEEEREVGLDAAMPFLLQTRLEELGGKLETAEKFSDFVIADGQLITGQNPPSSEQTAKRVIAALGE